MAKQTLEIIYQDDDIIVVNKPSHLLSIPDRYRSDIPNVLKTLREQFPEVLTVHRLDKDTTGVLCFARNAAAHKHLNQQFENQHPTKVYWALVDGLVLDPEGTIDAAIAEHPTRSGMMYVQSRGKNSVTDYKVVEAFRHFSIVEAMPRTGRTHQIRVHLAHIGNPLAVDNLYGQRSQLFLSEIKHRKFRLGKYENEQPIVARVPLHALSLTIIHPTLGTPMTFTADLPKDLKAIRQQLTKWDSVK